MLYNIFLLLFIYLFDNNGFIVYFCGGNESKTPEMK